MVVSNLENVKFIQTKDILRQHFSRLEYRSRDDLTKEQKDSIFQYKLNSSDINTFLRKEGSILSTDEKVLEIIPNIDNAFDSEHSKIPEDLFLFRGIPYDIAEEIISYSAYMDSAYVSTTFDLELAYDYSKYFQDSNVHKSSPDGFIPVLLILCDAGDRGIFLGDWECEILLQRAKVWTILSDKKYPSITIIPNNGELHSVKKLNRVRFITIKQK